MTHPRAKALVDQMKTAPIDLGFVVEVDLHIRKGIFGKKDVVLLHEALETISKLPNSMDYRSREMVMVENLYLHLQNTGFVGHGSNTLQALACGGRHRGIAVLICKGKETLNQDCLGAILLHNATVWHRQALVRLLVEGGVSPNAELPRWRDGSPLAAAAQRGYIDTFEYLLQSGADVHWKHFTGETILSYCAQEIAKFHCYHDAKNSNAFKIACKLARMGVNPNECLDVNYGIRYLGHNGWSPMVEKLTSCFVENSAKILDASTQPASNTSLGAARVRL